ncbi:MAG: S9 family peptidase [Firmicutes bacterium]|nr:S9 family peptidase [Bacillota bacterium]
MTPVTDEFTNVGCFNLRGSQVVFAANRFTDKMTLKDGAYCYDFASGKTETVAAGGTYAIHWIDFTEDGFVMLASPGDSYGLEENPRFYTVRDGETALLCAPDEGYGQTNSDSRFGGGACLRHVGGDIYYCAPDHVRNSLRLLHPDGRLDTVLTQSPTFDAFDVTPHGILYYGLGADFLQELFLLKDGKIEKFSAFNGEALRDKKISAPERLDARGEWESVEGFVLKPVDFDPDKRYPAVLNIHGGPKTAYGDTFFHENQIYANAGYFVLICNPWGSDGRGDKFADLRGRYGTVDFSDLMTFAEAACGAYPQIDRTKLGVCGGSYGGFMTNWIIGHTDKFRAAVSMRSISNWISMHNTTDIGYFFSPDQIAATPWENEEKLWEASPLKYADRVKTPTLFLHSDEDYRCWLAEGLQMFTALKYHGVPARLCLFRGENHELSRSGKPKHRVRRLEEIMAWFAQYFKD